MPHNTTTHTYLKLQHHVAEIRPLDLWHRAGQHLLLVSGFCVESIALARARSTRPSGPLPRACLCMSPYVDTRYIDRSMIILDYRYRDCLPRAYLRMLRYVIYCNLIILVYRYYYWTALPALCLALYLCMLRHVTCGDVIMLQQ